MGAQQFCLRWNNHQSNLQHFFDNLLQSEAFVDVTIACEGLRMNAHKVVLSACSPFFQTLFVDNPCKHPIVILKDITFFELKSIIEFMYKGEVNVSQDKLAAFLKTAETLQVKGLVEVQNDSNTSTTPTAAATNTSQPRVTTNSVVEKLLPANSNDTNGIQKHQTASTSSPVPKRKRSKPVQAIKRRSNSRSTDSDSDTNSEALKIHLSPIPTNSQTRESEQTNSYNSADDSPQRANRGATAANRNSVQSDTTPTRVETKPPLTLVGSRESAVVPAAAPSLVTTTQDTPMAVDQETNNPKPQNSAPYDNNNVPGTAQQHVSTSYISTANHVYSSNVIASSNSSKGIGHHRLPLDPLPPFSALQASSVQTSPLQRSLAAKPLSVGVAEMVTLLDPRAALDDNHQQVVLIPPYELKIFPGQLECVLRMSRGSPTHLLRSLMDIYFASDLLANSSFLTLDRNIMDALKAYVISLHPTVKESQLNVAATDKCVQTKRRILGMHGSIRRQPNEQQPVISVHPIP